MFQEYIINDVNIMFFYIFLGLSSFLEYAWLKELGKKDIHISLPSIK